VPRGRRPCSGALRCRGHRRGCQPAAAAAAGGSQEARGAHLLPPAAVHAVLLHQGLHQGR